MAQILKQSTAVDVLIGPFLDLTDGATAETGESPAVKLSKNGQALAAKNDATTPVHDADGYYNCELDATDTGTVGTLVLTVAASANALPVRDEFQVLEEAIYDALFASSAGGFDSNARVDVGSWLGTAVTLGNGAPDVNIQSTDDIDLSATQKASVNTEVDNALDTAVPGAPTADSINERVAALDDLLQSGGSGDAAAILTDTAEIGAAGAGLTEAGGTGDHLTAVPWNAAWDAEVQSEVSDALDATIADSTPADGSRPSVREALLMITRFLMEKDVSSTTVTMYKEDGTTSVATFTLDSSTDPTSITRST